MGCLVIAARRRVRPPWFFLAFLLVFGCGTEAPLVSSNGADTVDDGLGDAASQDVADADVGGSDPVLSDAATDVEPADVQDPDGADADLGRDSGDPDAARDADVEPDVSADAARDPVVDVRPDVPDADPDAEPDADPDAEPDADPDAEPDIEPPWTMPPRPSVDPSTAGASWQYGGGSEYPDTVDPEWPIVTRVSTRTELLEALASALPGSIVYVEDDAAIELELDAPCLNEGVWLASGRGVDGSAGALLSSAARERPMLRVCGDDVRITGLRLQGFDAGQCPPEWPDACSGEDRTGGVNCRDCEPATFAIQARGADRLEVDNNEIAGWSYAGVWLSDSVDNAVHHNDIHHTQRQGLGYGVVLTRGGDELVTVDIMWNRFDYNRHAVAGSGEPGQDYVARNNLVLEHSIGHIFDMHGEAEGIAGSTSELAGGLMEIYDNTVLCDDQYTLVVRGRPEHGAYLYDNCLARSSSGTAALQRFFSGNFFVDRSPVRAAANLYDRLGSECETVRWCGSDGVGGPWRYLLRDFGSLGYLGFGDFDGDGVQDAFRALDGRWEWSRSATEGWARLNSSSYSLESLHLADFDGDGTTDVFRASGSEWVVSYGGTGRWTTLREADETLGELGFGDFDGDGQTDAFRTTGSEWSWSPGASAEWRRLNASSYDLAVLGFGDFDGDDRTDVIRTTGTTWEWSRSGSSSWATLNTSGTELGSLRFADIDGDGSTDVVRANADHLLVSWGGASGWEVARIGSFDLDEIALLDLDGDGAADVFRTRCY